MSYEQHLDKTIEALDARIRHFLNSEPSFYPTTKQLDRYNRMPISIELKRDLALRYAEFTLGDSETHGNP